VQKKRPARQARPSSAEPASQIQAFKSGFIRIKFDPQGRFLPALSGLPAESPGPCMSGKRRWQAAGLQLEADDQGRLSLSNSEGKALMQLGKGWSVRKKPFASDALFHESADPTAAPAQGGSDLHFNVPKETCFFGLGDKAGALDKAGLRWDFWNTDAYRHGPASDPLYKTLPVLMLRWDNAFYGLIFDAPGRSQLDLGRKRLGHCRFSTALGGAELVLVAGPGPKDVLQRLNRWLGRPLLPPLWSLGFHLSRWGYKSAAQMLSLARKARALKLPLDCLHFDIDHQQGYRSFTFDAQRFSDPKKLFKSLKALGVRSTCILDPGLKKDAAYPLWQQAIKRNLLVQDKKGGPYTAKVWPGEAGFPDFFKAETRRWWAQQSAALRKLGVDGLWCDMNEPAAFDTPHFNEALHATSQGIKPHQEVRNLYGSLMAQATYQGACQTGTRPFVLSRSAYLGVGRHAAVWTGDNSASFEYMQMGLQQMLSLGLSGAGFAGTDIGGFDRDSKEELFIRWMQLGSLSPFCRVHASAPTRAQEPWAFGPQALSASREWLGLRYQLLPTLMSLFDEYRRTGLPPMRALFVEFPGDAQCAHAQDSFMLGSGILAAPVLMPGVRQRSVALPQGVWMDAHSGRPMEGGRAVLAEAPLERMPLYLRAGSIIASMPLAQSTAFIKKHALILNVMGHPGAQGSFTLFEDDGDTLNARQCSRRVFNLHCTNATATLDLPPAKGLWRMPHENIQIHWHGPAPRQALADGKPVQLQRAPKALFAGCTAGLLVPFACRKIVMEW
jgi:alpha-glucosidase